MGMCSCGGALNSKTERKKAVDRQMEYLECAACGRVGFETVKNYAGTEIIGTGAAARQEYARLCSASQSA
ncbi:TPA: hypothetical protein ACNEJR_004687 [Escherichia coli]